MKERLSTSDIKIDDAKDFSEKEVSILIPDANCPSCVHVIENHFKKHHQILASVNFVTKSVTFGFLKNAWTPKKIIKELKKIGFEGFYNANTISNAHLQEHYHDNNQHQSHFEKHLHHKLRLSLKIKWELTIAILLLIPLLIGELPFSTFTFLMNPWWQFSVATIVYCYFGKQFAVQTYHEMIKQKRFGMNSLIFIATSTAYFYSCYLLFSEIIFNHNIKLFFDIASVIIIFVIIGETISHHLQKKAMQDFTNLTSLQVKSAIKINMETRNQQIIKSEFIKINDYLLVSKGAKIPTDGIVVEGSSQVDQSLMTGEATFVTKNINDYLIGGTINQGNPLIMRATEIGQKTVLANIIKAVEKVQSQKPQVQKIVDKIAAIFTPIIILLALFLFFIYYFAFNITFPEALKIAITTLVIACPCALGIATPLAIAIGTSKATRQGIVFRQSNAFEKIKNIKTICFDKTGTITTGKLQIDQIFGDQSYLTLAIELESYSTHPISSAFKNYHHVKNERSKKLYNVEEIASIGLKADYQNQTIYLTSLTYALQQKWLLSTSLQKSIISFANHSHLISLTINQEIVTVFALSDELRKNAQQTINKFIKQGINVVMISGDNLQNTQKIANQVGIHKYYANVKPIEKAEIVQKLQLNNEHQVAFVGDGINDTVALEQANLAIAINSGSEIAINSAQVVIMNSDIESIYRAIVLTKKTHTNIYANLAWAFAYNLIALPLSAFGLISPLIATLAMSSSEILVVLNSIFFKIKKEKF